jgi:uncharacterized membrane protein
MESMKVTCLALLVVSAVLSGIVRAEVTFEIIDVGYATDISDDASVVVGNTEGLYEPFRWTAEGGIEILAEGGGSGSPDVSADGTQVSASIPGADGTYWTQGRWTLGAGWEETMPPPPPDGNPMSDSYGSAWGLSDDGSTVVGLYWRAGQPGGSAHGSTWTRETGAVGLGSSGGNSRANDANEDGTVIAGWDESDFGHWQPTVWVDGVKTILAEDEAFCEATAVLRDGSVVLGQALDDSTNLRVAARWIWNGTSWDEDLLGALPGLHPNFGMALCYDATEDGSVIVGYNRFSNPGDATGFIWTEETGVMDVEDYLTDNGVIVPSDINIVSLQAITPDGSTMVGICYDIYPPYTARWFFINTQSTGIEESPAQVTSRVHAYPNPTRGETTLSLSIPRSGGVDLAVYDISGRLVKKLVTGSVEAGQQEVYWDGRDASGIEVTSGIYFCRLTTEDTRETRKITVLR